MDQSLQTITDKIFQLEKKFQELNNLTNELKTTLILYEQKNVLSNSHYENIANDVKIIKDFYEYFNQQFDKLKQDILDIKIKVSTITILYEKQKEEADKKREFWFSFWRNKHVIMAILVSLGLLYEISHYIYYKQSSMTRYGIIKKHDK